MNNQIEKWKETRDMGVSRELGALMRLERSGVRGGRLGYAEIAARMANGQALIDKESEDHIPGAFEHLQAYTRNVVSTIQAYLDSTQPADVCLVGGGGARFLVPDRKYDFLVVDNPEMANAMGYWAWAVSHL